LNGKLFGDAVVVIIAVVGDSTDTLRRPITHIHLGFEDEAAQEKANTVETMKWNMVALVLCEHAALHTLLSNNNHSAMNLDGAWHSRKILRSA
jgi:hypothetical protein